MINWTEFRTVNGGIDYKADGTMIGYASYGDAYNPFREQDCNYSYREFWV